MVDGGVGGIRVPALDLGTDDLRVGLSGGLVPRLRDLLHGNVTDESHKQH